MAHEMRRSTIHSLNTTLSITLSKGSVEAEGLWKWLATVAGARVARAGGAELAGAKGVCLASEGERGVR
jgi:activator of 2-hydroxyglutaryl-CoA dehydratase